MPEFPPTMTQPAAAALTPEQVLSMTAAPAAEATARYDENRNALARSVLANQMQLKSAQQLEAQRLAGEKDISKWHESAANIRAEASERNMDQRMEMARQNGIAAAEAQVDKMSALETAKTARDLASGKVDAKTGLFLPGVARQAGESDADFVVRASGERALHEAAINTRIDNNLKFAQQKMDDITKQHELNTRQAAEATARQAVSSFATGLPKGGMFGSNLQKQFSDAVIKLTSAGIPMPQALAQVEKTNPKFVGVSDAYNSAFQDAFTRYGAVKNPMLQAQEAHWSRLVQNPGALAGTDFEKQPDPFSKETILKNAAAAAANSPQASASPSAVISANPNPYFLPNFADDVHQAVLNYIPDAEKSAVDPGTLISMAHAGVSQKIDQLQSKLNDLGVSIDSTGHVNVSPTRTRQVASYGSPGLGIPSFSSARTDPVSPADMLDAHTKGVKLADQLAEARADQQKLAQVLSMAQGRGTNAPMPATANAPVPSAVIGMSAGTNAPTEQPLTNSVNPGAVLGMPQQLRN